MVNMIIKLDPEEDLYVLWSSIVDYPTMWGSKGQFLDDYKYPDMRELLGENLVQKISRADRNSCSSYMTAHSWSDDFELVYGNYGTIHRSDLKKLLSVLEEDLDMEDDDPRILALLTPIED